MKMGVNQIPPPKATTSKNQKLYIFKASIIFNPFSTSTVPAIILEKIIKLGKTNRPHPECVWQLCLEQSTYYMDKKYIYKL